MYGITHTNTKIPGYKTKALLRKLATLPSYHGIPSHWLQQTGFDWAQALNPFKRPDPWASTPPPCSRSLLLPGQSGQPGSGPMDQDRASQPYDATPDAALDPPARGPSPPLSTCGIAPAPDLEEEEGIRHPPPSMPLPTPFPDDGVPSGPISYAPGRSL